jgi:hypothetical protein
MNSRKGKSEKRLDCKNLYIFPGEITSMKRAMKHGAMRDKVAQAQVFYFIFFFLRYTIIGSDRTHTRKSKKMLNVSSSDISKREQPKWSPFFFDFLMYTFPLSLFFPQKNKKE